MNTNVIPNKSFYYKDNFNTNWTADQVVAYSLDIAIDKWVQDTFEFPSDRIIYASNDFTFRERTRNKKESAISVGSLDLPYLSYYRTGYSECDRPWWNNWANLFGVLDVANESYETKIGSKLRLYPVKIEYEATAFFNQSKDCEYALARILYDASNETILFPELVTSNGDTLKNVAIMENDIEFNPEFNERDWLEQNKIFTISMNWYFNTFMIIGADSDIAIAESVILDFLSAKKLVKPDVRKSEAIEALTIYFNGENLI